MRDGQLLTIAIPAESKWGDLAGRTVVVAGASSYATGDFVVVTNRERNLRAIGELTINESSFTVVRWADKGEITSYEFEFVDRFIGKVEVIY